MTRNTLIDLNNHLFEQLERLNDEELTQEEMQIEIERSGAMKAVAQVIISNAQLALKAEELKMEYGGKNIKLPKMLEGKQ